MAALERSSSQGLIDAENAKFRKNRTEKIVPQSGIRLVLNDKQRNILRDHAAELGFASLAVTAAYLIQRGLDSLHKDDAPEERPRFMKRIRKGSA